ncbi:MAG TPA: hypothetical protein VJK29_20620, partial [Terriglobales bacterium]|nr:hypothetical protein [Terriglobales bacterium]
APAVVFGRRRFEDRSQISLLEPDLAAHDLPDALSQRRSRAMLHEDSGSAQSHQLGSFGFAQTRSNDQHFSLESDMFRFREKVEACLLPQIKVEQHEIDVCSGNDLGAALLERSKKPVITGS